MTDSSKLNEKIKTTFCEFFHLIAEKKPHHPAIVFNGSTLSYQQIDQISDSLAYYLKSNGIKPNMIIGVFLPNSINLIISILAILKTGAVYLPLDPSYPEDRLNHMLFDASPTIILSETIYKTKLTLFTKKIFFFDLDLKNTLSNFKQDCRFDYFNPPPENLAYIVYTSGTTGHPKGIMVSHDACHTIIKAHEPYYPEEIKALLFGPISFDVSILIIFYTLSHGGTLYIPEESKSINIENMIKLINQHQINFLIMVPSLYLNILNCQKLLPSLKSVSLTGEVIPQSLFNLHKKIAPESILYNEYGPSEYAIGTSIDQIYNPTTQIIKECTIGKVLPEAQIYILDSNQKPVPKSEPGEIYIGGKGLAKGYLNLDALTKEKFQYVSINDQLPIRLYRTGDFGQYLDDGFIKFLGRKDSQIKIRGLRIELSEIEQQIHKIPNIKECAIVVIEDKEEKTLIAFYSAYSQEITPEFIRSFLIKNLPNPMIPSRFILLDKFPLSPNGKIDKKALTHQLDLSLKLSNNYNCSLTNNLIDIWHEVLKSEKITPHDNFFDLGGDSIQIALVKTMIKQKLNLEISITDLFQFPTIQQLVAFINNRKDLQSNPFHQKVSDNCKDQKASFIRFKNAKRSK